MLLFAVLFWQSFLKTKVIAQHRAPGNLPTANSQTDYVGGYINKSALKIGFLNNGRFCAPVEYLPDLPGALSGNYGYLGKLDLWIGIPDGPWSPSVWQADSNKYVSNILFFPAIGSGGRTPEKLATWQRVILPRSIIPFLS